ncbi:MAG: PbsX family transcriptional regulator [Betaproteobacteria bacterium]|nr:PbsX family transcriptional regulator [Betaproteobacteria bacterium]
MRFGPASPEAGAAGAALEVEVVDHDIRLRPALKRVYALRDLLAGVKRSNLHGEADFGAPRGRELL